VQVDGAVEWRAVEWRAVEWRFRWDCLRRVKEKVFLVLVNKEADGTKSHSSNVGLEYINDG